jgi:titin
VPTAPQSVTAAPDAKKGIDLAWAPPTSNGGSAITGYRIYRSTSPGTETLLTTVSATARTYRDASTARNRRYYYVIRAVNAAGTGPASAEVTAIAR